MMRHEEIHGLTGGGMQDGLSGGRSAMRHVRWGAAFAAIAILFAAGCTTQPIYNANEVPVAASKPNLGLDDVGQAILRAGASLGWRMKTIKPGHILAEINRKTHYAAVDVKYSTRSYSITYNESADLQYDGQNIHRTYNGWIQSLENAIRVQLGLF